MEKGSPVNSLKRASLFFRLKLAVRIGFWPLPNKLFQIGRAVNSPRPIQFVKTEINKGVPP
jgi:hypothetical protein